MDRYCYEEIKIYQLRNDTVGLPVSSTFAADFADIFEVRGSKRAAAGRAVGGVDRADQS